MLKKALNHIRQQRQSDQLATLRRKLMLHEARIGGTLFGEVPKGHRREFFCLDRHTWVWHEEWVDKNGHRQIMMTRYDVRPTGVLKSQNGSHYQQASPQEVRHLAQAARLYVQRVRGEVYSFAA